MSMLSLIHRSAHQEPVVQSLLDTDFYKLLMLQFIWQFHPMVEVEFKLTNRTKRVRLADDVNEAELREQLDYVQGMNFKSGELAWLRGQTFYGRHSMFSSAFLDMLGTLRLGGYHLAKDEAGEWVLTFAGNWVETTLWEIYALCIMNELRYRKRMSKMGAIERTRIYTRAYSVLERKLLRLSEAAQEAPLALTDFGTRRRHAFAWQEEAVLLCREVLGSSFVGTSNALLAMRHDLEAKGTNAHELPMVMAALAESDEELRLSQYRVLSQWAEMYPRELLVMLPDTFGTTQFLGGIPDQMAYQWIGARPDSKEPIEGGEELMEFWKKLGGPVKDRLIIFSDGLDVALPDRPANGADIPTLMKHFKDRVRVGFGFGTNLTNDFRDAVPGDDQGTVLGPLSLVCKASKANGRPCVKLSDVYSKATGPVNEIERYRRVFGHEGMRDAPPPVV